MVGDIFRKDPDYTHPREDHNGDGPCLACAPPSRKVRAALLVDRPRFEVSVTVERSYGTASGFDTDLSALRRFLEFSTARFCVQRKLTGRWALLVYVSRSKEVKP